ncbi:MAG: hypothetical protein Q4G13_05795 [Moraxella sp.]|nr:hypothetical protein [Moraxella sp.]
MKYPALLVMIGLLTACGNNAPADKPAETPAQEQTAAPADSTTHDMTASETHQHEAEQTTTDGEVVIDEVVKGFTAYGNKPSGWRVVVRGNGETEGNTLSIDGEGLTGEIPATRSAYAKGVEFSGKLGDTDINLNIRTEDCTDDEGHQLQSKATFDYGTTTYEGCAVDEAMDPL